MFTRNPFGHDADSLIWGGNIDDCYSGEWITGIAAQRTDWKEGEGGNMTKTEDGTKYTRSRNWDFPVATMLG